MAQLEFYNNGYYAAQDTNNMTTVTAWVNVSDCEYVGFYVENKTGGKTTNKVGLQCSPDGIFNGGWHDESNSLITGEGHMFVDAMNMSWVRMAVHTVEGGISTSDFYLRPTRRK